MGAQHYSNWLMSLVGCGLASTHRAVIFTSSRVAADVCCSPSLLAFHVKKLSLNHFPSPLLDHFNLCVETIEPLRRHQV